MTVKRLQNKVTMTLNPENFINALNPQQLGSELKVTLRIPKDMLDIIDRFRAEELTKESRNTWILRAIRSQINLKI